MRTLFFATARPSSACFSAGPLWLLPWIKAPLLVTKKLTFGGGTLCFHCGILWNSCEDLSRKLSWRLLQRQAIFSYLNDLSCSSSSPGYLANLGPPQPHPKYWNHPKSCFTIQVWEFKVTCPGCLDCGCQRPPQGGAVEILLQRDDCCRRNPVKCWLWKSEKMKVRRISIRNLEPCPSCAFFEVLNMVLCLCEEYMGTFPQI